MRSLWLVALVVAVPFAGCVDEPGGEDEIPADIGTGSGRFSYGWQVQEQSQTFAGRAATTARPSEAPMTIPMMVGDFILVFGINVTIEWADNHPTAGTQLNGPDQFLLELLDADNETVASAGPGPSPLTASWSDGLEPPRDLIVAADSAADANQTVREWIEANMVPRQWLLRATLTDTGDSTGAVDSSNGVTFTVTLHNRSPLPR